MVAISPLRSIRLTCRSLLRSPRPKRKQQFKSATTGVASKNMRNEINRLVNTVADPQTRKVRDRILSSIQTHLLIYGT